MCQARVEANNECKKCAEKSREEIIFKTFSPFCKKIPIINANLTDLNDRGISVYYENNRIEMKRLNEGY